MSLERFFEERKKKESQLKSLEMEYEQVSVHAFEKTHTSLPGKCKKR